MKELQKMVCLQVLEHITCYGKTKDRHKIWHAAHEKYYGPSRHAEGDERMSYVEKAHRGLEMFQFLYKIEDNLQGYAGPQRVLNQELLGRSADAKDCFIIQRIVSSFKEFFPLPCGVQFAQRDVMRPTAAAASTSPWHHLFCRSELATMMHKQYNGCYQDITAKAKMAKHNNFPPSASAAAASSDAFDMDIPLAYAKESTAFNDVYAMPNATTNPSQPPPVVRLTLEQERDLSAHGFPLGLAEELVASVSQCPVRFWVIDNSGSMWASDGHVLKGKGKDTQLVPVTRWAEMQATVQHHAELAGLIEATTVFHMLNHPGDPRVPQIFSVAEHGSAAIAKDIDNAKNAMLVSQPQGPTPLAERLMEIREKIADMGKSLLNQGQRAVIVLATDGLPTDQFGGSSPEAAREFVQILRSLQGYPVWLVVRLCTDDEETCRFYNSLDGELELPLEVLDDFVAESKEVSKFNSWLNYGLPIHRVREMGYQHRLFDLLDERALNQEEIKEFLELLFGKANFENAPDVHEDWKGFVKGVGRVLKKQQNLWNPRTKKVEPWVDVKRLERTFSTRVGLLARLGSSARRQSSRKQV
jgi:hypothetical protein